MSSPDGAQSAEDADVEGAAFEGAFDVLALDFATSFAPGAFDGIAEAAGVTRAALDTAFGTTLEEDAFALAFVVAFGVTSTPDNKKHRSYGRVAVDMKITKDRHGT